MSQSQTGSENLHRNPTLSVCVNLTVCELLCPLLICVSALSTAYKKTPIQLVSAFSGVLWLSWFMKDKKTRKFMRGDSYIRKSPWSSAPNKIRSLACVRVCICACMEEKNGKFSVANNLRLLLQALWGQ